MLGHLLEWNKAIDDYRAYGCDKTAAIIRVES